MKNAQNFFARDDIIKRGWTGPKVLDFYGMPSIGDSQGNEKKSFKFCSTNKVLKIEAAENFKFTFEGCFLRAKERERRVLLKDFKETLTWCENFKVHIKKDEIRWIMGQAVKHFKTVAYYKAGLFQEEVRGDWVSGLSFEKLMVVSKGYIKLHRSNLSVLHSHLNWMENRAVDAGCEFADSQKCKSILNEKFKEEFYRIYPDFESYCLEMMSDRFPNESVFLKIWPTNNKANID